MQLLVQDLRRLWRRAALIGAVLALLCRRCPADRQGPCKTIAAACRFLGSAEGNHAP